jgi:hypothetical protein
MRTRSPWCLACQNSFFNCFGRIAYIPALTLVAALFLTILPLHGQQNPFTQVVGNTDQGVVLPPDFPLAPRQDAGALAVIQAYRGTIGLGAWIDMQGKGELTSTAKDSTGNYAPENATFWIRGHHGYRLDIQKPEGMSSLRMDGAYGAVQHADGKLNPMDARDAVAGLVAFPMLMETNFPAANVILIDEGMATVDGAALHRITIERPWPGDSVDGNGNPLSTVTDLYFNPKTHLLMKSANGVFGTRPSPEQMLQVITYGSYRAVNGVQLPSLYRETLNGQILWTLQLSQIKLNQGLPQSDFHF